MIGVVGPSEVADRLVQAIGDDVAQSGDPDAILADGPDAVVAVGERAMSALARAGTSVPVVPVDGGAGVDSVPEARVPDVVESGSHAGFETRERPVIEVAIESQPVGRGVFDAMLVTSEPSRISEYTVETPADTDRFRADGVVMATPAGSHGYVRDVDGPVLDAGAGCLVVVPVGAFAIRRTVRVVGAEATLSVRVERDEGDVSLFVDGEERRRVTPGRPVTVAVVDVIETVISPIG